MSILLISPSTEGFKKCQQLYWCPRYVISSFPVLVLQPSVSDSRLQSSLTSQSTLVKLILNLFSDCSVNSISSGICFYSVAYYLSFEVLAFSKCWRLFILSTCLQLIFPARLPAVSADTFHLGKGDKQLWGFYTALLPGRVSDGQNVLSSRVPQCLVFWAWMLPSPLGTSWDSHSPVSSPWAPEFYHFWMWSTPGITSAVLSVIVGYELLHRSICNGHVAWLCCFWSVILGDDCNSSII